MLSAAIEGMFLNSELFDHQRGASNKGYKKIDMGTLVLSTQNLHLGNANVNLRFEHGMVSPAYKTYHIHDCSIGLIAEWVKSEKAKRFFYDATTVGASVCRRNVEWDTLYDQSLYLPSEAEQERLAIFLTALSTRIKKQTELIEHLKKYKRGVIKEFLNPRTCPIKNAVWSKATIGELGTFVKGAPLSKADISDEGTPFILYGELYTTYGEVINKVVRKTQRSVDNVYLSRTGDVLIPTSGETPEEISTASCVMVSGVILAGDLNIFRTSKVDGRIMSYVLNHILNSNIARIAQGKSVVHIQASEISKISISYPDENTQQQLISVFDGISEKITLAEEALAKMIMLKKSIIQKMFI